MTAQLNSPERLAHFFREVLQEVGRRMRLVESLDCRADRLGSIFSYFRRNPDEAFLYGRTADHPADQEPSQNVPMRTATAMGMSRVVTGGESADAARNGSQGG